MQHAFTHIIFALTLHHSSLAQRILPAKATAVSGDSVYTFETRYDTRQQMSTSGTWFFGFENFSLVSRQYSRPVRFLHGSFENRSYASNTLYAKGQFKNGLKNGTWMLWYFNGQLKEVENYSRGVHIGEQIKYASDGTMQSHIRYSKNGRRINLQDSSHRSKRIFFLSKRKKQTHQE